MDFINLWGDTFPEIGQHQDDKSMIMRVHYSGNATQIKAKSLAS